MQSIAEKQEVFENIRELISCQRSMAPMLERKMEETKGFKELKSIKKKCTK